MHNIEDFLARKGQRKTAESQDLNPSIRVMGYNTKLAVHYVQLRITLTRLTSDYSERPHCSVEPVVHFLVVPQTPAIPTYEKKEEISILFIYSAAPSYNARQIPHNFADTMVSKDRDIYCDIIFHYMQYFFYYIRANTMLPLARLQFDKRNQLLRDKSFRFLILDLYLYYWNIAKRITAYINIFNPMYNLTNPFSSKVYTCAIYDRPNII